MPSAASLANSASTPAFQLQGGTLGFVMWNTSAAALYFRIGQNAAATGTHAGIPLAAGSATDPKSVTWFFDHPLKTATWVNIYQASGGAIAAGVGYEALNY